MTNEKSFLLRIQAIFIDRSTEKLDCYSSLSVGCPSMFEFFKRNMSLLSCAQDLSVLNSVSKLSALRDLLTIFSFTISIS